MALKRRFSEQHILNRLKLEAMRIENDLIEIMAYVGEQFVADARQNLNIKGAFPKGDYTDQTANLRSSIGYFVLKDGVIIRQNVKGTAEGMAAAIEALQRAEPRIGAIQLIGVAGMDYASCVESKGYNVITSQADMACINLEKQWKKYAEKHNLKQKFNL